MGKHTHAHRHARVLKCMCKKVLLFQSQGGTNLIGAPRDWAGFSRIVMVVSVSFRGVSDSYSGIIGAESESLDCFVQHKLSFQIWHLPLSTREINDACLNWPKSFIPFTFFISHLPCPDTEGGAVGASLHQPSTLPCGIYAINTFTNPLPVSIHLSVYITPFWPLHPLQP